MANRIKILLSLSMAMLLPVAATAPSLCGAAECLSPGSLDLTFNANVNTFTYLNDVRYPPVSALALDSAGCIYAAGGFISAGGILCPAVVRR